MAKIENEKDLVNDLVSDIDFFCDLVGIPKPIEVIREPVISSVIKTRPIVPVDIVRDYSLRRADVLLNHQDETITLIEAKFVKSGQIGCEAFGQALHYKALLEISGIKCRVYVVSNKIDQNILRTAQHFNISGIEFVQWQENNCAHVKVANGPS